MSFYNSSPFRLVEDLMNIPFGVSDVYVVSDKQYKELKQKQATDEIAVLTKRLEAYERAADGLRQTIAEISAEYELPPSPPEE